MLTDTLSMTDLGAYFSPEVNTGKFASGYTLEALHDRAASTRFVLPVCSIGTPYETLAGKGELVLPPVWIEAADEDLRDAIVNRILQCFPYYAGTQKRREIMGEVQVKESPKVHYFGPKPPCVLALSIDTAIEQHGPHLPLATDTIQSYAVLSQLAREFDGFMLGAPLDYGHLVWGLPFGFSIDIYPTLLTRYVAGYIKALNQWLRPDAFYIVATHGSRDHHAAITQGLEKSGVKHWKFRWLHEPLLPYSHDRGDAHAGGVETALIRQINPDLVNGAWWPEREADLATHQMTLPSALELSGDLFNFIDAVEQNPLNGIVGNIRNAQDVDAEQLMKLMLQTARQDVEELEAQLSAS